jgi:hypothetical protein
MVAKQDIVLIQARLKSESVKATRVGHAVLSTANALITTVLVDSLVTPTMDSAWFRMAQRALRVSSAINIATFNTYKLRVFVQHTILGIPITTER